MKTVVSPRLLLAGALTVLSLVAPMSAHAATGTVVKLGKSPLGNVLLDAKGMTLYMFTKDTPNTSVCYGQCEVAWPPLLTDGKPVAGAGVKGSLLGTTTRKDGKTQVTYNGLPLYYWFLDFKVGDVLGQDVGKVWYVMAADGSIVKSIIGRVGVNKSPLGDILVGNNGHTLYMFDKDTKNTSKCYDQCATAWPPLLTEVAPVADKGTTKSLIGTTKRTDGKLQVTYNGLPLYYWAKDKAAGDVTGQAVGNVWWVLGTNGKPNNAPPPVAAKVSIATTSVGNVLVGPNGMTLYMFTKDEPNKSNCYDQCATNWPPLLTDMKPTVGIGTDPALLGTTTRTDGKLQVTYKGLPLYYWVKDTKAGDTTGQGVGKVWWVVDVVGTPLSGAARSASSSGW